MSHIVKELYKIFDRKQKQKVFVLLCMMVVGALLETMGVSLILPFVSLILDSDSIYENEWMYSIYQILGMKSARDFLVLLCVGLILLYLLKNVYLYFMYSIQYRFASNNKLQMSSGLFSIYLNKSYEYYLSRSSSEIVRNINLDVSNVFTLLTTFLQMLTEVITALGVIAVLFVMDAQMTLFVSVLLLGAVCVMKYIFKPVQKLTGVRVRTSEAEILKWLNQSVHGIKEIKVTESESYFWENYRKSGKISAEATRKFNVVNTIPQLFIELVFMAGILLYILFLLLSGKDVSSLVPQISTFAMAAIRLLPIANRLNRYLGSITYLSPSLENVRRELETADLDNIADTKLQVHTGQAAEKLKDKISLNNICFRYGSSNNWILNKVSLDIPIGASVGIIGSSGSGKTTLIDLLLGLLTPVAGDIEADGESIFHDREVWLNRIGYVSQSMYLSEDTLKSNIAFGVRDENIDEKKIEEVLKYACLEEWVADLPDGINTKMGEFGSRMSGGQKQRVCIARALYFDPEILIMDEATSALDYDTEQEIMENINMLRGKATLIIIAHRLRTIEGCDFVYQVSDGKIINKKVLK